MKKNIFVTTYFTFIVFLMIGCSNGQLTRQKYIQKILSKLEQINSATYYFTVESWAPGDTTASGIFHHFIKEYNNPSDSTIGASYVSLQQMDTTQMTFCYDGNMRATVYEDEKTIVIDSFNVRKLPFRPLNPPFFNYAKNIIRYALNTKDSISIKTKEIKDTLLITLTIFEDKQVEFFGKAHYIENTPYNLDETTSIYELWIDKSSSLPFRIRREMSHDISVHTCRNIELNKINIGDFKTSKYFQTDYKIETYGKFEEKNFKSDLIGKIAPYWVLQDSNKKSITFNDFKSKVLLIQFTSISCGPCRLSIPFIIKLTSEYDKQKLDFVAIEALTKNSNVIMNYQKRNGINYKFLMSTKDVTKNYQVKSFPIFFLLDKNRVIRKIIKGYEEGKTDIEIKNAINDLI